MILLREANFITVPWKNGGGWTKEILKSAAAAGSFDWRLSLATIEQPGPFSSFAGYDRTLILVRGAGVALDFGTNGRTLLRTPGQLAEFDGAWETSCTLIDGPSSDLNLIVSQERVQAQTRLLRLAGAESVHTTGWKETLLCCIQGSVRVESTAGPVAELSSVDVLHCSAEDGILTCAANGATTPAVLFIASLSLRG